MKKYLIAALCAGLPLFAIVSFFVDAGGFYSFFSDAKRILGLVGLSFLSIQLLLSSRIPLFERGYGLDKLIKLHRKMGTAALVLLLAHGVLDPISMLASYGQIFFSLPGDWARLAGLLALAGILLAGLTAIFRRALHMPYEKWKNLHRITYIVIPMVLVHAFALGTTIRFSVLGKMLYGIAVASYVLTIAYRIKTWLARKRSTYSISQIASISYDTIEMTLEGPRLKHKPGQFLLVQAMQANRLGPTHPFTISSPPGDRVKLAVKSVGDFTSKEVPALTIGDRVRVEGPFGIFTLEQIPKNADLVLIAGGIGITPFTSMLGSLASSEPKRRVRLIWGNKQVRDVSFSAELRQYLDEMPELQILHAFSEPANIEQVGRIPEVLEHERIELATGFVSKELLGGKIEELSQPWVMLCGPTKMINLLRSILPKFGVPKNRVFFERFDL